VVVGNERLRWKEGCARTDCELGCTLVDGSSGDEHLVKDGFEVGDKHWQ